MLATKKTFSSGEILSGPIAIWFGIPVSWKKATRLGKTPPSHKGANYGHGEFESYHVLFKEQVSQNVLCKYENYNLYPKVCLPKAPTFFGNNSK
jgi:hypothetical protein